MTARIGFDHAYVTLNNNFHPDDDSQRRMAAYAFHLLDGITRPWLVARLRAKMASWHREASAAMLLLKVLAHALMP